MITTLAAILGCALLFALAAALRPPRSCGGGANCGGCGAACKLLESNHEPH